MSETTKTIRQDLNDLAAAPHPLRDAYLEGALLTAWREGKLIPQDEWQEAIAGLCRSRSELRQSLSEYMDRALDAELERDILRKALARKDAHSIESAISRLERPILRALLLVRYEGWCIGLRGITAATGIPREICRAILRDLVDDGLAEYHRGLFTDDGEPAGSGYCITPKGARAVLPGQG